MKRYIDPRRVTLPAPAPGDMLSLMALARDPTFSVLIIDHRARLWDSYMHDFLAAVEERCTPLPTVWKSRDRLQIPGLGRIFFSVDEYGTRGRELDHVFKGCAFPGVDIDAIHHRSPR